MSRSNLPFLLRGYLFLGTVILAVAGVFYATHQVRRLQEQSLHTAELFARFSAVATVPATDNPAIRQIFSEVVKKSPFPIVLTNLQGRPIVWRLPGIEIGEIDEATLDTLNLEEPPTKGPMANLLALRDRFGEQNDPIPILQDGRAFGYVYYGETALVRQLRWIPLLQIAGIFLFTGLGWVGYRSIQTSQQRAIWIGLAKETAHQLGTPISSLLGWIELMREKQIEGDEESENITLPRSFFAEVLDEMENDSERLQKVAIRFGQVGSAPQLDIVDLAPIVSEAVRYFRRRIPYLGQNLEIRERYDLVPPVSINKELIEWVVENVLKNAVDATTDEKGAIDVDVIYKKDIESVMVRVTDNGRGMTAKAARQIFAPGFTTKQRGWGLGLTLAKRIVEDYHGGRIWVEKTAPERGTTITMTFPT